MNKDTLNILSDAISDVGSWRWWYKEEDLLQLEFCDIQLYDETKPEKASHTTDVLAVRFSGNSFAVFLDNLNDDNEKKWYERLYDDEIGAFQIDTYELCFDDTDKAAEIFDSYKNRTSIKDFKGIETIHSVKHVLSAKCGDVGFIAGGNDIEVVSKNGTYTEEEIIASAKRWWSYWRDYWRLRKSKDAYEKDWACEVTIPADKDNPTGNWYED